MKTQWIQQFLDLYSQGIAHAFILHFNVQDYATPETSMPVLTYLQQITAKNKAIVASYSRDRGIEFATASMKNLALEILGMAEADTGQNDVLAALQSVGGIAGSDSEFPRSPDQALSILDELLRANPIVENESGEVIRQGCAVILENTELICPDAALGTMQADDRTTLATIARWGRDTQVAQTGLIFLLTSNQAAIHSNLKSASNYYHLIEIPLPDTSTRQKFIELCLKKHSDLILSDLTLPAIANLTAGINLMQIENILLKSKAIGEITRDTIWERKNYIMKSEYMEVAETIDPKYDFNDLGGLDHAKKYAIANVIKPMLDGRKYRVPMGILLGGPPGTGKSLFAVAMAKESGMNCVFLRIGGNIASKWQGEGERNLEMFLNAVKSLTPCIIFIDEIDQAISRGEGSGNQQDKRIFQRLLDFMGDTSHRGEVLFLAATNRPDLLDSAMKRTGRFDEVILFPIPDETERKAIFDVWAKKAINQDYTITEEAIKNTDGWTGAEIEGVVTKATKLIEDEGLDATEAITEATRRMVSSTQDIDLMTNLCLQEIKDIDIVPPRYREVFSNKRLLNQKIKEQKAESADGYQPKPRGEREFKL